MDRGIARLAWAVVRASLWSLGTVILAALIHVLWDVALRRPPGWLHAVDWLHSIFIAVLVVGLVYSRTHRI